MAEVVDDDPQRCLDEARVLWDQASADMALGQFEGTADKYGRVITLLEQVGAGAQGELLNWITSNLANAHADRGACLLSNCGYHIGKAARALLRARLCGNQEDAVFKNILYCIQMANGFSCEAAITSPAGATPVFIKFHNDGNGLLRRPWPPGTPGRDWKSAAEMFGRAVAILPTSAPSYYGLGLAFGGMKAGPEAVQAWLSALKHEHYNFEYRYIFDDALLAGR